LANSIPPLNKTPELVCQVVLEYAKALGFIARESITREEIAALIEAGIEPQALVSEIQTLINDQPGILLGDYP